MTPAQIQNEIDQIKSILSAIGHDITGVINNVLLNLIPGAKQVLNFIHDRITDIFNLVTNVGNSVKNQIGDAIGGLVPGAIDFFISILRTLGDNIGSILGNLATAEEFVASAIGEIKKHAGDAAGWATGMIGSGIVGGLVNSLKFLEGQDARTVDHMLDEMLALPGAPPWVHSMLKGVRGRGAEWQAIVLPFLVGAMLRPIGDALLDPWLKVVAYGANRIGQTEIRTAPELVEARLKNVMTQDAFIDQMAAQNYNAGTAEQMLRTRQQRMLPEEAARLVFRGQWDEAGASNELAEIGIAPGRTHLKFEALRPLLSEDQIRQTYLRGIIDRTKHDELMAQHGYTQERINQAVNLYYLIPGPQDLIHMAIRNVFSPEIVERFKLFGDFPPAFKAAAAAQGISEDWALKYWGAHWIVPSNTEGFEMFQRTTLASEDDHADTFTLSDGTKVQNVIGRSTLQLLLREKDTAPYYRNKLTEIAYHPFTRIDVRRMFSIGSLDHAGVQRAYMDLGYSPGNALHLADFIAKFYAQAKRDKALPMLDGLRRRILALYEQEKLELSDASFALTDLGFTKEESDYWLQEVKLIQQAEDAKEVETGIGKLYLKDFIPESDARDRLSKAMVPAAAIDRLMRKWNLQREYSRDTEHFHKVRDLTKSEVTEAYTDQLMTEKDAAVFLEALGYPAQEAEMLLHLANYKRERATRKALQDAIKALYVSGIRDELTTSNALDSLALPTPQRDAFLAEWRLLRETRTERLPIATLRDMLKGHYLTRDDAFSHLKRHRYTDDDANILLDFWQGVKPKGA